MFFLCFPEWIPTSSLYVQLAEEGKRDQTSNCWIGAEFRTLSWSLIEAGAQFAEVETVWSSNLLRRIKTDSIIIRAKFRRTSVRETFV